MAMLSNNGDINSVYETTYHKLQKLSRRLTVAIMSFTHNHFGMSFTFYSKMCNIWTVETIKSVL